VNEVPDMGKCLATIAAAGLLVPCAAAAGYKAQDVANAGAVAGTVKLTGTPPKPDEFRVTKDDNVCGKSKTTDDIVAGRRGGLKNVVVSIVDIDHGKKPDDFLPLSVDQKGCEYVPRVQAALLNNTVTLINSDPILHNVLAYQAAATSFNVAMPFSGMKTQKKLDKPGVFDLRCDAGHTWMRAWIHVFDHPYFAVTGDDGTFRLEDVPPGKYKVRFWHEKLGTQTKSVEIVPKRSSTLDVEFKAD
jgi:plastocyanin